MTQFMKDKQTFRRFNMALVTTKEMFAKAYAGGYAVGAFNINNMEILQGIVDAAKETNTFLEINCFPDRLDLNDLHAKLAKEKGIRFNIYLLGAVISKIPFPFDKLAMQLIKVFPSNNLFRKIHAVYYKYSIENRIFKLYVRKNANNYIDSFKKLWSKKCLAKKIY